MQRRYGGVGAAWGRRAVAWGRRWGGVLSAAAWGRRRGCVEAECSGVTAWPGVIRGLEKAGLREEMDVFFGNKGFEWPCKQRSAM